MTESMFGILNPDRTVRPCTAAEWSEAFTNTDRVVARTRIGQYLISTVFVGVDPNYYTSAGNPAWFETMIFRNEIEPVQSSTSETWDKSMDDHRRACGWAIQTCRELTHQLDEHGYSLRAQIRQAIIENDAEHDAGRALQSRIARSLCTCDPSDGDFCSYCD